MSYYANNLFNTHYLSDSVLNGSQDLTDYKARIFGGVHQQDRMIADKKKTLDRAVMYSY